MAHESLIEVGVPQVTNMVLDAIRDLIAHLLLIKDDGSLFKDGELDVATMASSICSCKIEKAQSACDTQDDTPTHPPLSEVATCGKTGSDSAVVASLTAAAPDPNAQAPVENAPLASAPTNIKKASKQKVGKQGVQTRITNQLTPEERAALMQAMKNLKEGEFRRKLEDEIVDVIETTIAARELKKRNPSLTTIKTVRFSRATFKDLEDMGVKAARAEPIKLDRKKVDEVLESSKLVPLGPFEAEWDRNGNVLCENLHSTLKIFGDQFEPRTRCIADDIKKALFRMLKAMPQHTQVVRGQAAVLLEISVNTGDARTHSEASSHPNPAVVYGKIGTNLNGRFDYVSFTVKDGTEELILDLKGSKNLWEAMEVIDSQYRRVAFLCFITETKRLLKTLDDLKAHLPQVIAQSIAVYF
ncbi:hypothetical protein MD484_g2296, partial [Candolleomyces efflorescens]